MDSTALRWRRRCFAQISERVSVGSADSAHWRRILKGAVARRLRSDVAKVFWMIATKNMAVPPLTPKALFAHCVSLSLNAVVEPRNRWFRARPCRTSVRHDLGRLGAYRRQLCCHSILTSCWCKHRLPADGLIYKALPIHHAAERRVLVK